MGLYRDRIGPLLRGWTGSYEGSIGVWDYGLGLRV